MAQPLVTALQATGKIKVFQISICIVMLLELPLSYIILHFGGKPYMAMYPTIFVAILGLFVRFIILKKLVSSYKLRYFTFAIVGKNSIIGIICYIISEFIHNIFNRSFISLIIISGLSCLITFILIYLLDITREERKLINKKIVYIQKIINR